MLRPKKYYSQQLQRRVKMKGNKESLMVLRLVLVLHLVLVLLVVLVLLLVKARKKAIAGEG